MSLKICRNTGNKLINRDVISFHRHIYAIAIPHMICQKGLGLMITVGFKDHCESNVIHCSSCRCFRERKGKVHKGRRIQRLRMGEKIYV